MPLPFIFHVVEHGPPDWLREHRWPIFYISLAVVSIVALKHWTAGRTNVSERPLHGKVVLLTGGTSGVGAQTARELAARGAQIVLLTREPPSDPFLADYVQDLRDATGNLLVYAEQVDLASLHSVRAFATKWIDNAPPRRLDMIVLCAAVVTPPGASRRETDEGIEHTWMVNFVANFHLLAILSPAIKAQPFDRDVRIVIATCSSYMASPSLREPVSAENWSPSSAYARSKLALTVFAQAFQKHLDAYKRPDQLPMNARVILVDPGLSRTPGMRTWLTRGSLSGLALYLVFYAVPWLLLKSPYRAAQSLLYAAMDAELGRGRGRNASHPDESLTNAGRRLPLSFHSASSFFINIVFIMPASEASANRRTPLFVGADEAADEAETAARPSDVASDSEDDDAIDRYRHVPERTVDPRAPSARRRRGDAAFQQWIVESQQAASTEQSVDRYSTTNLIQRNEERCIITSPREYQTELFERAKNKNLIIVLDTGSGKTLIAALLLRHTLDQELERRALGQPHRVAFFLVEKVALCVQQYSVLRANLEHPVVRFHGDVAGIMRDKAFWDQQLATYMVFVCTAQILLDCLSSGFVSMNQVNLIILDEAHHTKKNHPYARIIKDHYRRQPEAQRPRILGMTASPVDTRTSDLRAAALELETMLCSEIATVSDDTLMYGQTTRRQVELEEYYDKLVPPDEARTPLWYKIEALMRDDYGYQAHLKSTREAASSLGSWCADRYWELLVTEAEMARRTGQAHAEGEADQMAEKMGLLRQLIRENATKPQGSLGDDDFSAKFESLHACLEDAFLRQKTRRCIVFVRERYTAFLLAEALQRTNKRIVGLSASYAVGSQAASGIVAMSFRDQVLALQRFRRGESNCLFATQVAEEGIDIPECDLIIRFDLYDSAIQYIQSKGRARQARSTYISMLERGNVHHLRRLRQATRDANLLRRFCSSLPADRKLPSYAHDLEEMLSNEHQMQKAYEVPETGARLTYMSSLEVLSRFVASLDSSPPDYVVSHLPSKKFVATVILPESSPIRSQEGSAQRNKQTARCSAAFEACVKLMKQKLIDGHLQPVLKKQLPQMRSARLALSSKKKENYMMRVKPDAWLKLGPATDVFCSLLSLEDDRAPGRRTSPLMVVTRFPLPRLEPTMLYFDEGRTTARVGAASPLKLSVDEAEALARFTLAIFRDVFSKEYSAGADDMPYLLAPVDGEGGIDWEAARAAGGEDPDWRGETDDFFDQKLVMDPWDGSRKFITNGVDRSLKPSDAVPEGVPEPKSRAYRKSDRSIKEYSNSLAAVSRSRQRWREDQPVVRAELLPIRRNFLDEDYREEVKDRRCWLILEPLRVSPLPIGVVSMALLVPVIMFRLDSALIATEACDMLGLQSIRPSLALEAMTKDSCNNTEEHGQERMDFQVGMGPNYERLEFLGDAFLKMATTISLFTLLPGFNEFNYHVERMLLVCNLNLFNHAVDRDLQGYIRSKAFDRRSWYPNLPLTRGKTPKTEVWHSLSDKSIADVCEALIGAAYVTGRDDDAVDDDDDAKMDLAVKAVTKMVRSKYHKMTAFGDYFKAFQTPAWQTAAPTAAQRRALDPIQAVTGYRFRQPVLLRSAFKHPSYPYEESVPNYQRLEFLGDALLDMAVVDHLFHRFPDADPQSLTERKTLVVSNNFFGYLAVRLGLHRHLLLTTSSLMGQIGEYVAEVDEAQALADDDDDPDAWFKMTSPPPKALSDMVEALVGAMFIDSRYDYAVVTRFVDRAIVPYFDDMSRLEAHLHPVTQLSQRLQSELGCRDWRLCVSTVPAAVARGAAAMTDEDVVCALVVHGTVVESATARTGREAKAVAAERALGGSGVGGGSGGEDGV
ncbi:Dicer-like protein 1 [Ophiocordyceps camponoti-floridani]|uniref:Dicer-like protein 1 n=1 Tax=Ophiocordyceps camponoti-floridani TaxID=2030778 RepID=A0A8H4Q2Y1_9HYPO|nr:Dicer-like protein 1 [Ophiocordyceps camponoti-floridani]